MYVTRIGIAIAIAAGLTPSNAAAENREHENRAAEEPAPPPRASDPTLYTPFGTSVTVGGGISGFVDEDMRDFADIGGAWDVRAVFGTRRTIAIEAAYTGQLRGDELTPGGGG